MQAYKERMSLDKHPADPESIEMEKSSDLIKPLDLNHYRIVNEIWHFCSVDWGSKCKAILTTKSPRLIDGQIYVSATIHFTTRKPERKTLLPMMSLYQICLTGRGCGPG